MTAPSEKPGQQTSIFIFISHNIAKSYVFLVTLFCTLWNNINKWLRRSIVFVPIVLFLTKYKKSFNVIITTFVLIDSIYCVSVPPRSCGYIFRILKSKSFHFCQIINKEKPLYTVRKSTQKKSLCSVAKSRKRNLNTQLENL